MNKSYREELKKNIIKEQIESLKNSDIIEMYEEITSELIYEDLGEMLKINYENDPEGAASAVFFGDVKSWNADYFMFDGYNNIKSYYVFELVDNLKEYLKADHLEEVVENYEDMFDLELLENMDYLSEQEDNYNEAKKEISKELDSFINEKMFFAFSESQFKEGLKKLNCKAEEVEHTFGGGYTKTADVDKLKQIIIDYDKKKAELLESNEMMAGAYGYELENHEYGYTRDNSEALEALGIDPNTYKERHLILKTVEQLLIDVDNVTSY